MERALSKVEEYADQAAVSACNLADEVEADGWSKAVAEDALTTVETLTEALGRIALEVREVLAAVKAATATARRRLGPAVDPEASTTATVPGVPGPRAGGRPRRRGLGPGLQGIR
ncbi:hypothetical protein OG462_04860 [Streptomyces sp. NBC_01077]|uniref:hypothetical protein n=1 Tax=Streptomyces sp. NBC_01077 TaxID=2903746 RepID=UPI003867FD4D|nr:hypothetical protein OG462_04860 [Streptomyces sp. NBC_01077]